LPNSDLALGLRAGAAAIMLTATTHTGVVSDTPGYADVPMERLARTMSQAY